MMFSELLQSQQTAPVVANDAPLEVYLGVARAAMHALVKRDGGQEGLENPRARSLLRELGFVEESLVQDGPRAILAQLDEYVAQQLRVRADDGHAIGELAEGLARVFGYGVAERRLLELAMHANRSRKVQQAMNLIGEVDDEEAAQLFADVLGLEPDAVLAALRRPSPFRRMQPFEVLFGEATPFALIMFSATAAHVLRNTPTLDAMLATFCRQSPKARLAMADFSHQADELGILRRYLQGALASDLTGVNVLLHGAPGTGKTELVRALVASLDGQLMEVPSVDENKNPLPPWKRLTALTATQEVMRTNGSAMVLFDEVEDVFPQEGMSFGGNRGHSGSDRQKAWLTQMLEANVRPTFWVCNEIGHIDPAYIRRFDMVVELSAPGRAARERLIDGLFADIPLKSGDLDGLKSEVALAPAHLERMAGVLKTIAPANDEEGGTILGMLECQTRKALDLPSRPNVGRKGMPYRQDCINTNVDLQALATALETQPAARLCLFGPPGTGKTEWARQLARRLGRPLHVKRASDLLSMYVGDSERLIRQAFDVASREGAVLLIDEADSLLRDRTTAVQGWEVSLVNEVLTCMETYEGLFIASTNLQDNLDKASARRFDFKVTFDYLRREQVQLLFADLEEVLATEHVGIEEASLQALSSLTPGDFANVLRQGQLLVNLRNPERLVELLLLEQSGKRVGIKGRRIGFV